MDKPVTFAICGLGIRGLEAYAAFQKQHPEKMKITAGADPDPDRRAALQANYGVPAGSCFATGEELLAQPRLADVMIIATQDRQHVAQALAALDKGYHLVLEKPISPLLDECLALQKKAHEANRVVVVCHVLRYTKFYGTLYELLRGGAIGRIESLDAVENVAYWHYAHSYVRGNWRRAEESSPMILAKSCHDMDIIRWLMGVPCESVSSYGSLDWFRAENAPDSCCFVRSSTPPSLTSLFTIGAIVTTHTWWSTSSFACASSSFADASTSELPMFTVPSETCFKPSPDPPASIVMETSGYFSMNMSAASSTSGFNAEEPAAVMEPVRAAASVASVVSAAAAVVSASAVVAAAVVDAVLLLPHPVIMLTAKTPAPASAITFLVFIISFSSSKGLCFCFSFSVQ